MMQPNSIDGMLGRKVPMKTPEHKSLAANSNLGTSVWPLNLHLKIKVHTQS